MRTHNFKKDIDCRLFYGLIIVMALLLTTIIYDACGIGPPSCPTCEHYGFDGQTWRCIGNCPNQECCNGECYNWKDCKYCDGVTPQSYCDPNQCQTCDGNGNCPVCGDAPNKWCCNGTCYNTTTQGCCNGEPYDKSTQKCCPGLYDTEFICDINSSCCDYLCCDPKECKTCGSGLAPCKVCNDNPNQKCCPGGVCKEKCKIIEGETCIMAAIGCTGTCSYGGSCSIGTQNVYSGITAKTCNPEGCTGDCHKDTTWCYRTYNCVPSTTYILLSQCTFTPGGIGLDHAVCDILTFSSKCYLCTKDTIPVGEPTNVEYDSCN